MIAPALQGLRLHIGLDLILAWPLNFQRKDITASLRLYFIQYKQYPSHSIEQIDTAELVHVISICSS